LGRRRDLGLVGGAPDIPRRERLRVAPAIRGMTKKMPKVITLTINNMMTERSGGE
jgi:hypothetical protein